ncbi:MAG: indolepyruvate ferredoxin oxidoreductase family protein, partial [Rhizobiales bacterium]|nr:indolepyruvate ferredoxin oxidoreductase family protein [Hyphomicrobiales bacterium]
GKGPGVDRSGDVFRHVNMAGTSPHGGVLVVAGDDHSGESSTVVHASDVALSDAMMPVLSPAGVQEIIDLGLLGYAMSRHASVWVGLKCVHDTVESSAVVDAPIKRPAIKLPKLANPPLGGLHIRTYDDRHQQEERLHMHKLPAVLAFARANGVNRIVWDGGKAPKLGIVSAGKAWLDVRQALEELGIDEEGAARIGIRLMKLGMVWPLEPEIVKEFAEGLDTVIVVEEKRSLIETQLRDILYNAKSRPTVIGKRDESGRTLFAPHGVLEPLAIASAIAARVKDRAVAACASALQSSGSVARNQADLVARVPYFCAGCPHNSSTVVPEGARAYAGIGCHWLAQFVPGRATEGSTQMGGEGANWVGEAPFSKRAHMFQNLGDGTYNHSGLMAIRHAVKSGVNITYKILFNDAVAMTGGQANDGGLTVKQIAEEIRAAGIDRIAIVSDEPGKHSRLPARVTTHHRDDLQDVQEEMQQVSGASVIIYDQTCAAEKRRRRKKGTFPDPARRVFINERVCEGCGDCGVQSNCVAIAPVETEYGRKRQIDQSACNKDFSCLKGFCPSFVTIEGGTLKKPELPEARDPAATPFPVLPGPKPPSLDRPWSMLITGIGGTGVVTIGHLLGQAAHIEGKGAALIDMVGISQKNGAVVTHLKIASTPEDIAAVRIAAGGTDLILGCDLVTAASERVLKAASRARTHAVVNSFEAMPADFTHARDFAIPGEQLALRIAASARDGACHGIDATSIAAALLGDSIAGNLYLLGFAYQKGLVPVSADAIAEAVRLNGVSVKMNLDAFLWGRRAAVDENAVRAIIAKPEARKPRLTLDELIAHRVEELTRYQDQSYAESYRSFVAKVREKERVTGKELLLTEAVAKNLFKLMAIKDEYEVARLYSDGAFQEEVRKRFDGNYSLNFHLAPPLLSRIDARTGRPAKIAFGPWAKKMFRMLAKMKGLRGTAFDVFGRTAERRRERELLANYKSTIERLLPMLNKNNRAMIVETASLPDQIRGFGPVKEASALAAKAREAELLARLEQTPASKLQAPPNSQRCLAIRPITLQAIRAAVKAAVPSRSRFGTNSTMVKPAIGALAATPAIKLTICVKVRPPGEG